MYMYVCTYICVCVVIVYMYVHVSVYMYVHVSVYMYIHVCVYVYVYVFYIHTSICDIISYLCYYSYSPLRKNIADKYVDIENQLVGKFFEALQASDVKRMRLYASTLQQFQHVRYRICNDLY